MFDILGYVILLAQSPVGLVSLGTIVALVVFFIYRWATRKPKQEIGGEAKEKNA
jgi:hypothetical protein